MSDSFYITRAEFEEMRKNLNYIADNLRVFMAHKKPSKWVEPAEAMELLGCKDTKLRELRLGGDLHWKTTGKGRGVQILRSSIDEYNEKNSTLNQ